MNSLSDYEIAFVQNQLAAVWPNWHISKKLGKGSYGSVYEIVRDDLGVRYTCALKVLHMETGSDDYNAASTAALSRENLPVQKGFGQGAGGQGSPAQNRAQSSSGQGSLARNNTQNGIGQGFPAQRGAQGTGGQGSLAQNRAQSSSGQGSLAHNTASSAAQARIAQRTVWNSGISSSWMQAPSPGLLLGGVTASEIEEFIQSVSSEIDLMMQLKGVPSIVSIEDYAILRDHRSCTILIRMEELEPLDSYLRRKNGILQKEELIRLGTDICTALVFCEQKNILHRDIKTSNLFYSPEAGFKLGDFGISRSMSSIREKASMSGIGTIQYMAPEVYQGRHYNNTADIYSLGIVLYILANGLLPPLCSTGNESRPSPLPGEYVHEANMRRLRGEALPYPRYADPFLGSVICTACSPSPEARFQTAAAFRSALADSLTRREPYVDPKARGYVPVEEKESDDSSGTRLFPLVCILVACIGVLVFLLIKIFTGDPAAEQDPIASSGNPGSRQETEAGPAGNPDGNNNGTQKGDTDSADSDTQNDGTGSADSDTQNDGTGSADSDIQNSDSGSADPDTQSEDSSDSAAGADYQTFVAWNDPNLESAVVPQVQEELGISGDITVADAKRVQKLDLTDAGITDISALRYFSGLTRLDLCNNFVADISPLSELTKLKDLNLEKNLIKDVTPLAGLVRLRELDLNENSISDISALSDLTMLTMLDIRYNDVSDISVLANMPEMEELYMSHNDGLYDLTPLSNMPALWYLGFKETAVSDISPLRNDTALKSLTLSWTNVSDISVIDNFPELSYLDIRGCSISDYGPADRMNRRKGSKLEK